MSKVETYNFNEGLESANAPTNPATSASTDLINKTYMDAGAPPKQYVSGTAYANGTPLVTPVAIPFTLTRAVLIPYQTSDGAWRLKFNIGASISSSSRSSVDLDISGIAFKTPGNNTIATSFAYGAGTKFYYSIANSISDRIMSYFPTTTTTWFSWSGDVELNGKPTWAD